MTNFETLKTQFEKECEDIIVEGKNKTTWLTTDNVWKTNDTGWGRELTNENLNKLHNLYQQMRDAFIRTRLSSMCKYYGDIEFISRMNDLEIWNSWIDKSLILYLSPHAQSIVKAMGY